MDLIKIEFINKYRIIRIPIYIMTEEILNINSVMWEPYFVLSKASAGQIIYTLIYIRDNIQDIQVSELLTKFIAKYENLLNSDNEIYRNVLYFNLLVNLPRSINVDDHLYGSIKLSKAKIGVLIKCLKQRVQFIINREIPIPKYIEFDIEDYSKEFLHLQDSMKNYYSDILEFEKEFVTLVRSRRNIITQT